MLALVLTVAVALLPHHTSTPTSQRQASNFPTRGVFVAGKSLAAVQIGDTQAKVRAKWGGRYRLCDKAICQHYQTWLYQYATGEGLGAAVVFENGIVTAVFTLGSPDGWKTDKGLKMGDVVSQIYDYYDTAITTKCLGYDAISVRDTRTKIVTSFYSSSGYVYGFALTGPSQPICQ
jgi:hypothetical protein